MWRVDNELQQMLRRSAEEYFTAEGGPAHLRACRELAEGFDAKAWKQMAELGWTGMLLPETLGGSALGLEPALTLAEVLGHSLAPEPFIASSVIAGTLLARATTKRGNSLAAALSAGDVVATLAWQEHTNQIGAGTPATRLRDGRLSGRKLYVPGWSRNVNLLVSATGSNGPVIAIVDSNATGVSATARRMTDATMTASIEFTDVAIDNAAVLLEGSAARAALDLALARGTLALCAQLDGLATGLWRITSDYLQERVQFGQSIADFQAIRHRLVDLYSGVELAAASWRAAVAGVEAGMASSVALHAAKARCSDVAFDMCRWAVQYHGAFGYTEEADVGLYLNTALRWSSWLGNAAAHRRCALDAHQHRSGKI